MLKAKTVREFLSKVINNLDEVIKKFEIENILDRKIGELAGGEFQKVLYIYSV
ncbi:hypothetical protein [Candidatus Nanopusillus massiliensis]|uniref:hypothetical protein n=1 Tax=Candidatus Nanopusillus massiliensis TaxID=2897163 RepID=UPI001E58FE18|nr:hypothetical protein [Candidatus Nanopusillus massiliensis]